MSQPVIFDIAYTPYRLKKGSSQADINKHAKDRAFFDMSGQDNNIYKYMTAEGKIMGEETQKFTMLEYLQKSTGVVQMNRGCQNILMKATYLMTKYFLNII